MNDLPLPAPENRSVRSARFQNHLHRYKNQLRRRWWVVPLIVFAALGFQAWRLYTAPPIYSAQGRMIVNYRVTTTGAGNSITEELSRFIDTQGILMKSPVVLKRAEDRVRNTKPDLKHTPVKIEPVVVPKTTIFLLTATGEEPEYTTAYLQACMDEYLLLKKEMRTGASDSTLSTIMGSLTRAEQDIKRGEEELQKLTDRFIEEIAKHGQSKEKEIMED